MLKVENVYKTYNSGIVKRRQLPVLNDISFEIPSGISVGLMGDSGCGKSTLARILIGLLNADSGRVIFDGRDISELSGIEKKKFRRKMQIVFQNPESSLNPRMTILQNMLEPMIIQKLYSTTEQKSIVLEKIKTVGLSDNLLLRYPREISGGEAQRIVLARILTLNPSFIILDEPTSMLDMSVQAQILDLLKRLQAELNLTYLLISHDKRVVEWFTEQTYLLKNGTLHKERSEKHKGLS